MKLITMPLLGLCLFVSSLKAQITYYSTSTANVWSLTLGGASCGCSPTSSDYVVISHNWANSSFYPLTHPANLAFGNFLSVNPARITVKNGGVAYQQPTLVTGTEVYVEAGGFWGYNGSLVMHGTNANAAKVMQNSGVILVNGSYDNNIAINSTDGVFCKNGSWVNTSPGSLNGITDANMDSYFTQTAYGCTNCCLSAAILPVQLTTFEVQKDAASVVLSWTTASEINNDYFEVQSSVDGENWIAVAVVKGAGTTNNGSYYSVIDNDLIGAEVKYYRLKQVDFDGTAAFSFTKSVQIAESDGDIEVFDNGEVIVVQLNLKAKAVKTSLLDMNGKPTENAIQGVLYSDNSLTFSKTNLVPGIYIVQVVSQNQVYSKKVFIAR